MDDIHFVDTTIRDGHASLWAERMTTGMMLPIAERLDEAGFEAIELIASSHFKKSVCELREDPWERIRLVAQRIKKTPLRADRRPGEHVRFRSARHVPALYRTHGRQRHKAGSGFRSRGTIFPAGGTEWALRRPRASSPSST